MVRTSIVLGVVSLLLLGFILIFERGTVSTGELEARQGRVLAHFVRDRVSAIEIQKQGVTTRVARGPDPENDLDLGQWKLEAPLKAAADQDTVEVLVGELEWLEARRTLDELSAADRARFGLDKPRYRVSFENGKVRDVLLVGANAPTGEGTYVALAAEPARAYVVGKDLIEAIDQEPGHYHTKELHDGLTIYGSERMLLRDADGERVLVKQQMQWQLEKPEQWLASLPALEGLFSALDGLRASRFVTERPAKLSDYGLDKPVFEVQVTRKRYDDKLQKPTDELETHTFVVGKACAGHEHESYLRMGSSGPVLCVLDEDWKKAQVGLDALREKRLLPLEDTQIERLELSHGAKKLVLTDKDDVWSYALSDGKKTVAEGKAHTGQLQGWLKQLGATQVQQFAAQDQVSAGAAKLSRVAYALRVERTGDYPPYAIEVGDAELDGVPAHRNQEPALLRFGPEVTELLAPVAARLLEPTRLSESEGKLASLEVQRAGGTTERAERGADGRWHFAGTAAVDAPQPNAVTLGELARQLSQLQALRLVADAADTAHGLAQPALSVKLAYLDGGKRTEHALRIGAETSDGRFATLDQQSTVFVVPSQLVAMLQAPLASQPIAPQAAAPAAVVVDAAVADEHAPTTP